MPGGLRLWRGAAPWSGGAAAVHLRSWLISHPALVRPQRPRVKSESARILFFTQRSTSVLQAYIPPRQGMKQAENILTGRDQAGWDESCSITLRTPNSINELRALNDLRGWKFRCRHRLCMNSVENSPLTGPKPNFPSLFFHR